MFQELNEKVYMNIQTHSLITCIKNKLEDGEFFQHVFTYSWPQVYRESVGFLPLPDNPLMSSSQDSSSTQHHTLLI